ncbi:hypothetical protein HNP00_004133 [Arthrobacter sp. AZCC_0090]|nr:hypothetical protein [Arthrobacter sp. AZCC_0090]
MMIPARMGGSATGPFPAPDVGREDKTLLHGGGERLRHSRRSSLFIQEGMSLYSSGPGEVHFCEHLH